MENEEHIHLFYDLCYQLRWILHLGSCSMHRRSGMVDWITGNEPPSKRGRVDHPDQVRRDPASLPPTPRLLDARARGTGVGNPALRGRELFTRYKRPHGELFDNNIWNPTRQVYECPTCGIYASNKDLKNWYHPGVRDQSLAEAYLIEPGTRPPVDLFEEEAQGLDDRAYEEAHRRRYQFRGSEVMFRNIPEETAVDAPEWHRVRYLTGCGNNPPPILTCSRACYMQQFNHNEHRNDLNRWLKTYKRHMPIPADYHGALQHSKLYPNLRSFTFPPTEDLFASE